MDGERRVAAVQGGFLSVTQDKITVLADWAIWSDEVDEEKAQKDFASEHELTSPVARPHSVQFAAPRLNTLDW